MFQSYFQPFLLCLPLFISSSSFSFLPSLSHSLRNPCYAPLSPFSHLFPPLFLTLYFSPLPPLSPPVSSPSLPPPVLALSPITGTIFRTKGQHLDSDLGTPGARGGHCVPWFILGLPQLCAVQLGSSVNFPSSETATAALCSKKSKGEGYSADGLFCLHRNQHSPQRNVFTSMIHKA